MASVRRVEYADRAIEYATERRSHPSGRPIGGDRVVSIERGTPRIPNDGPLTPRLRATALTPAIGFLSQ